MWLLVRSRLGKQWHPFGPILPAMVKPGTAARRPAQRLLLGALSHSQGSQDPLNSPSAAASAMPSSIVCNDSPGEPGLPEGVSITVYCACGSGNLQMVIAQWNGFSSCRSHAASDCTSLQPMVHVRSFQCCILHSVALALPPGSLVFKKHAQNGACEGNRAGTQCCPWLPKCQVSANGVLAAHAMLP